MIISREIRKSLEPVLKKMGLEAGRLVLEHPAQLDHGDYSTNIALAVFSQQDRFESVWDLANGIINQWRALGLPTWLAKVEVAQPGFINLWFKKDFLGKEVKKVLGRKDRYGLRSIITSKKTLLEFAHPNTHKEFHLAHLRNLCLGESLSRLLMAQGTEVIRVNYQGDIGLHVAKCLWQLRKMKRPTSRKPSEKAAFLAKAYVLGHQAYETDKKAHEEIAVLNRELYAQKPAIRDLWIQTRSWSLKYFRSIYLRLGVKFDRLYFESEVAQAGKELVEDYVGKVFKKSQGAIIFPGEKYGLHNRVFLTQKGLPTYEAKDMALAKLQFQEYNPELIIHVVGPEQRAYFQVIFKALGKILPKSKGKEFHLRYGWVSLKEGKMSSRTGNVVTAEWLLDEAKKRLLKKFEMPQTVAEKVAVGAVKYSLLKFGLQTEIVFDIEESISLEGNSGPYLQYTYVRSQSVIKKTRLSQRTFKGHLPAKLAPEEEALLRTIYRYPEIVSAARKQYAPNLICNFLFDLAQRYNLFYNQLPILKAKDKETLVLRVALTLSVGQILKNGLRLLAIEVPEKM